MKIVIPMAGSGKRFREQGYNLPKPLIEVDGKPIIQHIVENFPGESDFIFICNHKDLEETKIKEILEKTSPGCKIVSIEPHKKGPVYTTKFAFDEINDKESVIVNYCDFSWYWDYQDFKKTISENKCDAAVTAYKDFHPHLLEVGLYASMRVDEQNWMLECREKHSFTESKMDSFQQSGTFYFSKGSILKKHFNKVMELDKNVNGEYYISDVTQSVKEDDNSVFVYPIDYFCQWGTPQDLEEYNYWSDTFKLKTKKSESTDSLKDLQILIPMAGEGSRFKTEGYSLAKPLISVSGKSMIVQATNDLPKADSYCFLCRKEHIEEDKIDKTLQDVFDNSTIITVEKLTEGQASTCLLAEDSIDLEKPLLIGACDNGMIYEVEEFINQATSQDVDSLIFTFRNNSTVKRNPKMYGWVKTEQKDIAVNVSCKIPISDNPIKDHAVVGSFYFKKAKHFFEGVKQMITKNIRVNGEFYVDTVMNELIENGLSVKAFEIDKYICWGTPNDLKTYEYWQNFFDINGNHPYKKELDEDFA